MSAGQEQPRVSVCMATWNGAEYVEEQLLSILAQLASSDEIVVVDDASADETVEIVLGVGDPRIRLLRQLTNTGYIKTFERALGEATGQYLFLSDQDDVWLPGRLNLMLEALQKHDVVAGNLATLGGSKAIRGPYGQADWRLTARSSDHHLRNIVGILAGNRPYYGCALDMRSVVLADGVLPFPTFLRESHDLWISLYGNISGSMGHCDARVLERRYHGANQTPNRPRGPVAVIRSRIMLLRCAWVLLRRTRGKPASR